MKRNHVIALALVSAAAASALAFSFARPEAAPFGAVRHLAAASAERVHFGGPRHWGAGEQGERGLGRLCAGEHGEHLRHLTAYLGSVLGLNDGQARALDDLRTALEAAGTSFGPVCAALERDGEAQSAPAMLAGLETAMIAGVDAIGRVRPAFDGFYAALDDGQRTELDGMLARRH